MRLRSSFLYICFCRLYSYTHARTHAHAHTCVVAVLSWLPLLRAAVALHMFRNSRAPTERNNCEKVTVWGFRGPAWLWLCGKRPLEKSQLTATFERSEHAPRSPVGAPHFSVVCVRVGPLRCPAPESARTGPAAGREMFADAQKKRISCILGTTLS